VFGILLTLLILDGILLMVVVLLQAGKGGGLAAMGGGSGGTESFMGGRQAATVLTKATWATGAVFLALAVVLSVLSTRRQSPTPLLQDEFQTQTAPQPILPGGGEPVEEGVGDGEIVPGVGGQAEPEQPAEAQGEDAGSGQ
jgi:preprotein translocase subunit SecG